jgi:hypothetical protein
MKPSEISSSLQLLSRIQKPAFLWGPPGAGKSQVVAQVAAALSIRLIDIRAVLLDPVDLRGLPTVEHGKAAWAIPAFLPEDGAGILFLDELNAAPPLVQAACYQLVLDRALGDYRLPDGWTVFAAGNREGDRAVTSRMSSALANRFVHLPFEPDLDDWSCWAMGPGDLRPEVVAFLRWRPELLHRFDPAEKAFPSPRAWASVSHILAATRRVTSNSRCMRAPSAAAPPSSSPASCGCSAPCPLSTASCSIPAPRRSRTNPRPCAPSPPASPAARPNRTFPPSPPTQTGWRANTAPCWLSQPPRACPASRITRPSPDGPSPTAPLSPDGLPVPAARPVRVPFPFRALPALLSRIPPS